MKILFFTELHLKGGVDSIIVMLCNHWPNFEDELFLLCNKTHPGLETYKKKITRPVNIVEYNWPIFSTLCHKVAHGWWRKPFIMGLKYGLLFHNTIAVWLFCRKHKIDRVHVINGGYPAGDACRAASLASLLPPYIKSIHNFHNMACEELRIIRPLENICDRLLAKASVAMVTVSNACCRSLVVRPFVFNNSQTCYIYNGVTKTQVTPHYRKDLQISSHTPFLAMIGTYEQRKGHAFILQAFQKIVLQYPSAQLVFCGGGTEKDRELVKKIVPAKIQSNVHCLSFFDDISTLMSEIDVLLVGSQSFESFGLTPLEAALVGTPSVVTNIGGLPEVVLDGETGFVVPHDNPNLFSEKVITLLKDATLREKMGRAAQVRAENEFTPQKMAASYAHIVRQGIRLPNAQNELNKIKDITK